MKIINFGTDNNYAKTSTNICVNDIFFHSG